MADMSEKETREEVINPQLEKAGWKGNLKKYIKEEVNSVKSNFKINEFIFKDANIERGVDRFIDYLLLADDNSPLAVIEAKKSSLSFYKGRIQADSYAKDIEKQTGEKIPIFLTNGHEWMFIDQTGFERKVSGVFSQEDLKRRRELFRNRRKPSEIKIDDKILDRIRNIEIVKQLAEHFEKGNRSALVSMATGTGKTRVAMGVIKTLMNANYIRKVLFIVDRITLSDQAKSAFSDSFREPICELNRENFSSSATFYVSTVQTLSSEGSKNFQNFGAGAFDLIIYDEAHRSYYDRQNIVMKYFDGLKIGLTATPSKGDSRNTFALFDCEDKTPTVEYSYEDAVRDLVLAPYNAKVIETKVLAFGIKGKTLTKELKNALMKQEEDPEALELPGSAFERVFLDEKTNELIIRQFMDKCYKSGEGLPCKTIFFCASKRHAREIKRLFNKLYPIISKEVKVILSDMDRYTDEVQRFKLDSEPRIVLSVGILDTGVDIPEVCNLVFVKPVYSHIRFWQMLGRGTRNIKACKHKEWLPQDESGNPVKNDFLILDFMFGEHSNVKYHKLKETKEKAKTLDAKTQIFLQRVDLLEKPLEAKEKEIIETDIINTVNSLDKNSFIIREKTPIIKKVLSKKFDLKNYVKELREEIAPLLIFTPSDNAKVYSFILKVEKLFDYIKEENVDKIDKIREYVLEKMKNIMTRQNLEAVALKMNDIKKVFQEEFWEDLTFEKVKFMVKELAPLMVYYLEDRKNPLEINAPDYVVSEEEVKMELKEDGRLAEFIYANPLIKKLRDGEGITSDELLKLEKDLSKLNPNWTIENIQKIRKIDFLVFLHQIIGLTKEYDPKELIEREFDKHIIDHNQNYNSEQITFLRYLKKIFAVQKHLNLKDFAKHPLKEERPWDLFQEKQLAEIVQKCQKIKMK